jgi:hypothetical protein
MIEIPIKTTDARRLLGCGVSRFSAIKSVMGIKHRRYVFFSKIAEFLAAHPDFDERDVYHRSSCGCVQCEQKRAGGQKRARQSG